MSQSKRMLEEQEAKDRRKEDYLINVLGYERCSGPCGLLKSPEEMKSGSLICDECWDEKMKE